VLDARRAADRRDRERDRGFGEAVDRAHRLGAKAVGCEAAGEPVDRVGAHRLGAV
jgi:hypothetical protein